MHQRSIEIDITKGVLTLGMVLAHVIQFLTFEPNLLLKGISTFTNLVSFSGFYFCFGYAVWVAYLQNKKIPWPSVLQTVLKCYFAFLISGIAYAKLVANKMVNVSLISDIATFRIIPGYSEFLISFSLVTLVATILAPVIFFCTQNTLKMAIATLACTALTLLPKEYIYDPFIGLFIGGAGFAYFPVLQYMPLFLFGVYIARHQISYNSRLLCISFVLIFVFVTLNSMNLPINRFPPSAIWVFCSAALLYIYYGIAILISKHMNINIKLYLNAVGQNVLSYLLLSNIVLFSCTALGYQHSFNSFETLGFYIAMMTVLFYIQYIGTDLNRANKRMHSDSSSATLH